MRTILLFAFILSLCPAQAEPLIAKPDFSEVRFQGPKECWTMEGGVLTGKSLPGNPGSILWTKSRFENFILKGEFKFSGKIDSGIFLRTEVDQIQIGVSGSLKRDMTCSPYISKTSKYPVEADVKGILRENEWNAITIQATGARYVVSLNGKQVLDWVSETAVPEGPIGLQVHPGVEMKIEFRNLEISQPK